MLDFILHPIQTTRMIRHIADQLTPEDLAELKAAKTESERAEIQDRIISEIFPVTA